MSSRNLTKLGQCTFKEIRTACFFILPLVVFVVLFVLVPVLGTFINSTFQDVTFTAKRFNFLENYKHLWMDPSFFNALKFTLLFVLVSVPIELVLGLVFAVLLDLDVPFRGILRGCVLIPWAIPAAISARTWELIYNYSYGLANFICLTLGLSSQPVNWLGTS